MAIEHIDGDPEDIRIEAERRIKKRKHDEKVCGIIVASFWLVLIIGLVALLVYMYKP